MMETSIVRSALAEIRRSLPLPARIVAVERLDETALGLQVDDGDRRARIVIDVHPASATFHLSSARKDLVTSDSGVPRLLEGAVLTAVAPADEPRCARLLLRMPELAFLAVEWTGRSGNARIVLESGEVVATLRAGGPGPGDVYAPPPPDRRPALDVLDPSALADAFRGSRSEEWPLVLRRMVRDLDPLQAFEVVHAALSSLSPSASEWREQPEELRGSARASWADEAARRIVDGARSLRPPGAVPSSIPSPLDSAPEPRAWTAVSLDSAAEPQDSAATLPTAALYYYSFPGNARLALPGHRAVAPPAFGFPAAWVSSREHPALSAYRQPADEPLLPLLARAHHANRNARNAAQRKASMCQRLQSEQRRLLRLRGTLSTELGDGNDGLRWRRYAEAILTHLREVPKGASVFICPDLSHPDGPALEIPLDPARSAKEAADDYFRRARRWDRGRPIRVKRIQKLDEAIVELSLIETRIAESNPPPGWEGFENSIRGALRTFYRPPRDLPPPDRAAKGAGRAAAGAERTAGATGRTGTGADRAGGRPPATRPAGDDLAGRAEPRARRGPDPRERFRPREFGIRDGWTVIVGRSNEENDYVTHSLARQDDLWFHASGVPGSHVVLKKAGRKDNPSTKAIEEAAAIAAYYSKARHSKKAPVVYTLKKYVSRPRKAKPGLAQITREKTVLVLPWSPAEEQTPEWMEE